MKFINLSLNSGISDCLINKIAQNDDKALVELYDKTKKIIFSIALSITKSPSESEDITQETYIKIIENAKNYEHKGKPLAWICTITKNLSFSSIRKNKNIVKVNILENDLIFLV